MSKTLTWKGAPWLAERMAGVGFGVGVAAKETFTSEAVANGFLAAAEDYDRFWAEWADEFVRNGFRTDARAEGYHSAYVDGLLAGRDVPAFVEASPGLFGWSGEGYPAEMKTRYAERVHEAVAARKAVEMPRPEILELTRRLVPGPAAAFGALAAATGLEVRTGRDLGVVADGVCLMAPAAGELQPFLFWETGHDWRADGALPMACGILAGGRARLFDAGILHRGLTWYARAKVYEEAALGIAAYAQLVVELSAALKND